MHKTRRSPAERCPHGTFGLSSNAWDPYAGFGSSASFPHLDWSNRGIISDLLARAVIPRIAKLADFPVKPPLVPADSRTADEKTIGNFGICVPAERQVQDAALSLRQCRPLTLNCVQQFRNQCSYRAAGRPNLTSQNSVYGTFEKVRRAAGGENPIASEAQQIERRRAVPLDDGQYIDLMPKMLRLNDTGEGRSPHNSFANDQHSRTRAGRKSERLQPALRTANKTPPICIPEFRIRLFLQDRAAHQDG